MPHTLSLGEDLYRAIVKNILLWPPLRNHKSSRAARPTSRPRPGGEKGLCIRAAFFCLHMDVLGKEHGQKLIDIDCELGSVAQYIFMGLWISRSGLDVVAVVDAVGTLQYTVIFT